MCYEAVYLIDYQCESNGCLYQHQEQAEEEVETEQHNISSGR